MIGVDDDFGTLAIGEEKEADVDGLNGDEVGCKDFEGMPVEGRRGCR